MDNASMEDESKVESSLLSVTQDENNIEENDEQNNITDDTYNIEDSLVDNSSLTEELKPDTGLKAGTTRSRSRSPIGINTEFVDCKVLNVRNLPFSWTKKEVEEYLKKSTSKNEAVYQDIEDVELKDGVLKNGTRFVKVTFKNAASCNAARQIIKERGDKIKEHNVIVQFPSYLEPHHRKIKKDEVRVLIMTHTPTYWSKLKIEDYLKQHLIDKDIVESIQYIYMVKKDKVPTGTNYIRFSSSEMTLKAFTMLKKVECKPGTQKIWFEVDRLRNKVIWKDDNTPDFKLMKLRDQQLSMIAKANAKLTKPWQHQIKSFSSENAQRNFKPDNRKFPNDQRKFQNDQRTYQNDQRTIQNDQRTLQAPNPNVNNTTYGLSVQFLESLGISPPLVPKVFIGNLVKQYDDELKIRTLFGHAGIIISVAIIERTTDAIKLKVEFDHPLEAVQAISMFHNQEVYGKRLVVSMDWNYNAKKKFMPDGLKAFGPGLDNGFPMRGIRAAIEMRNLKNELMNEIQRVAAEIRQKNEEMAFNDNQSQTSMTNQLPAQSTVPAVATINPLQNQLLALNNLLNPQAAQMLQLLSQNTAILGTATDVTQGLNSQAVGEIAKPSWNTSNQAANLTQNVQPTFGVNNVQNVPYVQSGLNVQAGMNVASGTNVQVGTNMQSGPNMQVGPSMHSGSNMQFGLNMQGGANMQVESNQPGPINQGGPNMHTGPIVQAAPVVYSGPNTQQGMNMQGGTNMQIGYNMDEQTMHRGQNVPSGNYTQGRQFMPSGQNMPGSSNMIESPASKSNFGKPQRNYGRPEKDDVDRKFAASTVLFNYLPPSVNLEALKVKMQEIGDVKNAELTGPGRAVVVFWSKRDSDACIKLLDRTKVDGQTIDVRPL